MTCRQRTIVLTAVLALAGCQSEGSASSNTRGLILATTTSVRDSGLLDVLLKAFTEQTGIGVKPVAVGSGQALAMGRRGDADALLVHAPQAEEALVREGFLINRRTFMHNYFVIIGPSEDPAGVRLAPDAVSAMRSIAKSHATFLSRGDNSGTHQRELALWKQGGLQPRGDWYVKTGAGMAATLQVAGEKRAYTLSDIGTFLAFKQRIHLVVLNRPDPTLLNIYSVMQVNPAKFRTKRIHARQAQAFVEFVAGPDARRIVEDFGRAQYGRPLFIPGLPQAAATKPQRGS